MCPDCTDGRMSWERMAAIVTAVFNPERSDHTTWLGYLRAVQSPKA